MAAVETALCQARESGRPSLVAYVTGGIREDWTDLEAGSRAIVTIRTRQGRTVTENVQHRTMTWEELQKKFDALVLPRFGPDRTAVLASFLSSLESAASVKPIMAALGST